MKYFSGYLQNDWRISSKLTVNYGIRLERETGVQERSGNQTVNFDQTAVSPLNSLANLIDPVTGQRRQIMGGPIYAGQNGAPSVQGDQPAVKPAPRAGIVYSLNEKTVIRGGWGLYYSPWNDPAAGTTGWGQIGYSATTLVPQSAGGAPTVTMSNPFPSGLVQPSGSSNGLLTGVGGDVYFVDPSKGSRLTDNQFGESNYYSSAPGLQNNYTVIPGSPYYKPDQEYGRSLLDSPHKIVVAPTFMLPFGHGKRFLANSQAAEWLLGGWSITPAVTLQSGFPIGISRNQPNQSFLYGNNIRPNLVPGPDFLVPGGITERVTANTTDNLYLNKAAFSTTPANQFGNAPRPPIQRSA